MQQIFKQPDIETIVPMSYVGCLGTGLDIKTKNDIYEIALNKSNGKANVYMYTVDKIHNTTSIETWQIKEK